MKCNFLTFLFHRYLQPYLQFVYRMSFLSLSDMQQQEFSTYLGPLKNYCCPKLLYKSVCQYKPKTELPAQPIGQSCQKMNLKKHMVGTHHKCLCLRNIFKCSKNILTIKIYPLVFLILMSIYLNVFISIYLSSASTLLV